MSQGWGHSSSICTRHNRLWCRQIWHLPLHLFILKHHAVFLLPIVIAQLGGARSWRYLQEQATTYTLAGDYYYRSQLAMLLRTSDVIFGRILYVTRHMLYTCDPVNEDSAKNKSRSKHILNLDKTSKYHHGWCLLTAEQYPQCDDNTYSMYPTTCGHPSRHTRPWCTTSLCTANTDLRPNG